MIDNFYEIQAVLGLATKKSKKEIYSDQFFLFPTY